MRQREVPLPVGRDAALLGGLAPQLQPGLEHHAEAGRADGVPEALEAPVGVHRELAVELERAGELLLPGATPLAEAEILHQHELGRRETVVHLRHRQLGARVGDAGLAVGLLRGEHHLGERRVVVVGVAHTAAVPDDERECLHVERVLGVAVGVLGPDDHGGGRAVGDPGAVEHRELPGDARHREQLLDTHLLAELRPRIARAVGVVLRGDARQCLLHLVHLDAVALGVGGDDHGVHGGGRDGAVRPVARHGERVGALEARVLELLHSEGHRHVIGAARYGVGRLAQRLRPRRAEVLDPGDRLVLHPQWPRQHEAAHARLGGAEPIGVHVGAADAGRVERALGGLQHEVVRPHAPVLAELRARHPDDGDLVGDPVRAHQSSPPRHGRAFQK